MLNRRQMLAASGGAVAGLLPGFPLRAWAQTARKAYSLHIGVNVTDPAAYPGGIAPLQGCVNDAEVYKRLAIEAGFHKSHLMEDGEATINEVARYIKYAADHLGSGDLFFVSYAGHGASVSDESGDESDRRDESWCLHDGLLIDDYLYWLWARFAPGTRLLVISDSCHSGSVARVKAAARAMARALEAPRGQSRSLVPRGNPRAVDSARAYARRLEDLGNIGTPAPSSDLRARAISQDQASEAYDRRAAMYRAQQDAAAGANQPGSVQASGILLAACQDHEVSWENGVGGLGGMFTKELRRAFDQRQTFQGYSLWQSHIASQLVGTQTPNFFPFGQDQEEFFKEIPFTI